MAYSTKFFYLQRSLLLLTSCTWNMVSLKLFEVSSGEFKLQTYIAPFTV